MTAVRTFIHGSCVARDVVRVTPELFSLNTYVARQSWASGYTKAAPIPDLSYVDSNFRRRSLEGDFSSSIIQQIRDSARRTDTVLIDIASDRHGIAAYEGGYVSLTPDHQRAFGGVVPGGRRIAFGSDRHLQLFKVGAVRAARTLARFGLLNRSLVLGFPFSNRLEHGGLLPETGDDPEEINELYTPYYATLKEQGFTISWLPHELAMVSNEHTWGPGLDHFTDAAYKWWANQISAFSQINQNDA